MTNLVSLIEHQTNAVLLETVRTDSENYQSYLFLNPLEVLTIFSLDEVPLLFQRIEESVSKGFYVAGYCAYEMGFHFEKVSQKRKFEFPLAWFGVYDQPTVYEHSVSRNILSKQEFSISDVRFCLSDTQDNAAFDEYAEKIQTIRRYISEGDVYQINFTGKVKFSFEGSVVALYESLKRKQKVAYNAVLQTEHGTIISLSPELFFRRSGSNLITRPMKGTAPRGKTLAEDVKIRAWLKNDEKSRAENIMIVDLLRNDMGKVSEVGSVKTTSLCEVEKYETLFQMISTIESQLHENVTYYDIFKALFPSGSVTGAPKIRAMQLINEVEQHHRGVYTGAIGFMSPKQEAVFNVAIRTIVLRNGKGEMGTGGGIVWDSKPEQEYNECLLKAKFLTEPYEEFSLIETILWNNGFPFLERHLTRIKSSAEYFGFPFDETRIRMNLVDTATVFSKNTAYKVRLLLNERGDIEVQTALLAQQPSQKYKVCVSSVRTNSSNRFLYHKTTNRNLYDRMYYIAQQKGYVDVLFLNEKEEVTEGAISNVIIKKNGKLFTPPIECGLLRGVYRQHLLETLDNLEEQRLSLEQLFSADAVYLCNAVRGMFEVEVDPNVLIGENSLKSRMA